MDGPSTRTFNEEQLPRSLDGVLKPLGMTLEDVGLIVPRQANVRRVGDVLARAGARPEQLFMTGREFGNTGAASIPITLGAASVAGCTPVRTCC